MKMKAFGRECTKILVGFGDLARRSLQLPSSIEDDSKYPSLIGIFEYNL